ncbi:MAG: hypothetical protein U0Z44_04475 [Kouleothrix sp.]
MKRIHEPFLAELAELAATRLPALVALRDELAGAIERARGLAEQVLALEEALPPRPTRRLADALIAVAQAVFAHSRLGWRRGA